MGAKSRGSSLALQLGLATLVGLVVATAPAAAETELTRAQYTERVESICKPSWRANPRHLTVAERIIDEEELHRYPIASSRMMTVFRNTSRDVRRITVVPRPTADAATIRRWIGHLRQGRDLQRALARALKARQKGRVYTLSNRLASVGEKGNRLMVIRGFSFKYCRFEDTRS